MLYIIALLSSIISGMGIGGGSIYILLTSFFQLLTLREAMMYNLVMFIAVASTILFSKEKKKKINKKILGSIVTFVILGCLIGCYAGTLISKQSLKLYFNILMLIIGIYEIISSFIVIKKGKL